MSLQVDELEEEEEEEVLGLWNSLEDLSCTSIVDDKVCPETYGKFFSFHAGADEYVIAYIRKAVGGIHTNQLPDEKKHYAIEAAFDAHVEFKHVVGLDSKAAFDEMVEYLKAGESRLTVFASEHRR